MAIDFVSLIYPFTLGILALFSPCGYALLPGYISYHLGSEASTGRALKSGFTSTAGLITIYSAIGLSASTIGGLIYPYIPFFTLIAGFITITLGAAVLADVTFPSFHIQIGGSSRGGLTGFYIFGVAYGLAASGCTAPIFIYVILYAIVNTGPFNGLSTFIAYALGVGLPLILTSVLVAQAKHSAIARIHSLTPMLHKISGVALIGVGIYLLYLFYINPLLR